jgi:hypothetical protein
MLVNPIVVIEVWIQCMGLPTTIRCIILNPTWIGDQDQWNSYTMEFTRVTSYTQRTIQALQAAGPFGLSGNARNIILAQEMINIKA